MSNWVEVNNKDPKQIFRTQMEYDTETGEVTKFSRYRSTKFRSRIYFELERQVIDVIRKFMSGKICHLMHDGFFTPQQIDMEKLRNQIELESHIKEDIKFNVKISSKILSPES